MATRFFGERIRRNEDPRLLTGKALFVDDVNLPNMAHAAFVRSPHARARINGIDKSLALEQEGVIVMPGSGLGKGGEGFFRVALTASETRLTEAAERLGCLL